MRVSKTIHAWIGLVLLLPLLAYAQDDDNRVLSFFEPVRGTLSDATPFEDWTLNGHEGEVISLLAVTTGGDLDPVIELIGPDGARVAQNDDLDSLVRDAGLEAYTLPMGGVYTVRVARYLRETGATSGSYELTLTPGFAQVDRLDTFDTQETPWIPPDNESITWMDSQLRLRALPDGSTTQAFPSGADPLKNIYYQTHVRLFATPSYAEFGLTFRAQNEQAYQFKVNTEGQWTVLLQDPTGIFALRSWSPDPALAASEWTLAVLARDDTFSFFANGSLLGTLQDVRLMDAGAFGVLAATREGQPDAAVVLFDDILITQRLGTTYQGLPLALTTWNATDPTAIRDELAGHVTASGERDLYVPQTAIMSAQAGSSFELVGSAQALYGDFLLGATVSSEGQNVGCGLVYRWQDEANLTMAFVDTTGGFGIVQAQDGDLTTNAYDLTDMVLPDLPNKVLILARGDQVVLYVNGALVAQETVAAHNGRVGGVLLNYDGARGDCFLADIWVWPLDSTQP